MLETGRLRRVGAGVLPAALVHDTSTTTAPSRGISRYQEPLIVDTLG
jgi:hypothetical protein